MVSTREKTVVYHGYAEDHRVRVMETMGYNPRSAIYPLPHPVKHSPSGFSWGYGGSGPADLARSLLIHALNGAKCPTCGGSGWIAERDGDPIPAKRGDEDAWYCENCEEGVTVTPEMYQQFKWDVIARYNMNADWELNQSEVLKWIERHRHPEVAHA